MKNKKSFSKIDYFFFVMEEYRDRLTLVIVLNLIALILGSKLNDIFKTIYLESRFKDIFGFLSHQSDLVNFYEALFYGNIIGLILQLAGSKTNKNWIFILNGWFLFFYTTYYWGNLTFASILDSIMSVNYIFYFVIIFQLLFYIIFFNENFKLIVNRAKINHS